MAIVILPFLTLSIIISYYYRYNFILFSFYFSNKFSNFLIILKENYFLYFLFYFLFYFLLYLKPFSSYFIKYKLNKNYPLNSLILLELFRSLRGILICSIYEYIIQLLILKGYYQWNIPSIYSNNIPLEEISPIVLIISALILFLWGDFHFYWTHRLLHTNWLYKNIHKYHHESYNPDPFSGLSMHWIESSIYFSSAFILGLTGCPIFLVRLMFKSLIIFPLEGHSGFGSWDIESSNNHYIHHSKFNWNYGSSPMWDYIMKTNYPIKSITKINNNNNNNNNNKSLLTEEEKQRINESIEQAKLVGCELSDEDYGPTIGINNNNNNNNRNDNNKQKKSN